METRKLLAWISMALTPDAEDAATLMEGSSDQIYHRHNVPYFNPTPDEIRAAILEIQAGWTDEERLTRADPAARQAHWRVPHVRGFGLTEPEK